MKIWNGRCVFAGASCSRSSPESTASRSSALKTSFAWRWNLIEEALKYAPESAVEVAVRRARDGIALAVRDDGPGLSTADRARVRPLLSR
jgi:hypothetical protein